MKNTDWFCISICFSLVIKASDGSLDIYGNPGFDVTMNYADGFGRCEYKAREYTVHDRPTSIKLD